MRRFALSITCLTTCLTLLAPGCSTDADSDDVSEETSGDGDGDPSTGDGDGDPSTGDGDGDPSTGDGDGDPTTGDGDGDPTTGDGDGDPSTGDGDGEPDMDTTLYDGEFLLALSTTIEPSLPLQFIVTVDASTQFVDLTIQPLSLDEGSTTAPREPVGEPLVYTDVPHVDGQFTLNLGEVMVTGQANPITGSDIVVQPQLEGGFVSEDALCGAITGDLIEPFAYDLAGSTFAAIRVADTSPMALPTEFPIDCDGI